MVATRRFGGAVLLDRLVLDKSLAEIVNAPAVTIFTCPCIGDSYPAIVDSMTAVEAARVFFCFAIPRYSIPYLIISDSEPAFASDACKELAKMFGVPEWDFGAVTSPQHHAKVEVRMKPYNEAIAQAVQDGRIQCRRTLEVVLACACITQTQHNVTNGSTAFTRLTGAIPRTVNDLFSSPQIPDINLKSITESDKVVVAALINQLQELCDWHQEKRDAAHRSSLFSKLVATSSKRVTDFFLLPGDMVSYQGQRWKLLDLHGPPNQPITADIQQATHADAVLTKTVRYETLQNLSAARETVDIYADRVVNPNDYIFYTDPNGLTCSGKVTAVNGDSITLHAHDPSPQLQTFLPNWTKTSKTGLTQENSARKQPKGFSPEIVTTKLCSVDVVTKIDGYGHVPKHAMQQLKSRGVMLPFEYTAASASACSITVQHAQYFPCVSRRDTFAITSSQHQWIIQCLREFDAKVTHDAFSDHALRLHIIVTRTRSPPSQAAMDSDDKAIRRMVRGLKAASECRTNQVFRIHFLMQMYPHEDWLQARQSRRCLPHSASVRYPSTSPSITVAGTANNNNHSLSASNLRTTYCTVPPRERNSHAKSPRTVSMSPATRPSPRSVCSSPITPSRVNISKGPHQTCENIFSL